MEWLQDAYPDLVDRYEELYTRPYGTPAARRELGRRVGSIVALDGRHHGPSRRPLDGRAPDRPQIPMHVPRSCRLI